MSSLILHPSLFETASHACQSQWRGFSLATLCTNVNAGITPHSCRFSYRTQRGGCNWTDASENATRSDSQLRFTTWFWVHGKRMPRTCCWSIAWKFEKPHAVDANLGRTAWESRLRNWRFDFFLSGRVRRWDPNNSHFSGEPEPSAKSKRNQYFIGWGCTATKSSTYIVARYIWPIFGSRHDSDSHVSSWARYVLCRFRFKFMWFPTVFFVLGPNVGSKERKMFLNMNQPFCPYLAKRRRETSCFVIDDGTFVELPCGTDGCNTTGAEHSACLPMPVPENDPTFADDSCIKFVRTEGVLPQDCGNGTNWKASKSAFVFDSDGKLMPFCNLDAKKLMTIFFRCATAVEQNNRLAGLFSDLRQHSWGNGGIARPNKSKYCTHIPFSWLHELSFR